MSTMPHTIIFQLHTVVDAFGVVWVYLDNVLALRVFPVTWGVLEVWEGGRA